MVKAVYSILDNKGYMCSYIQSRNPKELISTIYLKKRSIRTKAKVIRLTMLEYGIT